MFKVWLLGCVMLVLSSFGLGAILQDNDTVHIDSLEVDLLHVDSVSFGALLERISVLETELTGLKQSAESQRTRTAALAGALMEINPAVFCSKMYSDVGARIYGGFGTSCYFVFPAATWDVANATCYEHNAHLVSVESAAETDYLIGLVSSYDEILDVNGSFLMGLYAPYHNHTYVWESNPEVVVWNGGLGGEAPNPDTYINWYQVSGTYREPSTVGEYCSSIYTAVSGYWNDLWCSSSYPFICELTDVQF